ncbi:MAG: hypothetical protein R3A52_20410 [Polyangiales bacterium]
MGIRARLFAEGHDRVVIHTDLPDGSHAYTIAKRSEFVKDFPCRASSRRSPRRQARLGGGSTVGGAPRAPTAHALASPPRRSSVGGRWCAG